MPKPPAPPPDGLDEVERALSVLGGRHPEHERTRRETLAAADRRRHEIADELARGARQRRRRVAFGVAAIALGIAGAVGAARLGQRSLALREALGRAEEPFAGAGTRQVGSNRLWGQRTLELETPGPACLVALATSGQVRVRAAGRDLGAGASLGWCACGASRVTLEPEGAGLQPTGLAVLALEGGAAGGPLARAWTPLHPAVWAEGGAECAEAMLDSWLAERKEPAAVVTGEELSTLPGGGVLRRAGFHVVASVAQSAPFGVVESGAGECLVAIAPGADLSLRAPGGRRVIPGARGALAWCTSAPTRLTLWRGAGGPPWPVVVSAVSAATIGGLTGARECARDAGTPIAAEATWIDADALGSEARALLRASRVQDAVAAAIPGEPGPAEARVVALAIAPGAGLAWTPPEAPFACDPAPPSAGVYPGATVCAYATAVSLWRRGEASGFVARGTLPIWMATLTSRTEPDASARIPEVLTLARRLARAGFEPTILEGVVEMPGGVRIVGRAGEDGVVAVGLGGSAPWTFPYTDGPSWDLGDEPRVVALRPGASVTLVTSPRTTVPVERRRTVVFRRSMSH